MRCRLLRPHTKVERSASTCCSVRQLYSCQKRPSRSFRTPSGSPGLKEKGWPSSQLRFSRHAPCTPRLRRWLSVSQGVCDSPISRLASRLSMSRARTDSSTTEDWPSSADRLSWVRDEPSGSRQARLPRRSPRPSVGACSVASSVSPWPLRLRSQPARPIEAAPIDTGRWLFANTLRPQGRARSTSTSSTASPGTRPGSRRAFRCANSGSSSRRWKRSRSRSTFSGPSSSRSSAART